MHEGHDQKPWSVIELQWGLETAAALHGSVHVQHFAETPGARHEVTRVKGLVCSLQDLQVDVRAAAEGSCWAESRKVRVVWGLRDRQPHASLRFAVDRRRRRGTQ